MVAASHVWQGRGKPADPVRHASGCAPYLPYPRFMRDLHDLQDLPLPALPFRLRALAQRIMGVREVCVLTPHPSKLGKMLWRNEAEGHMLPADAQNLLMLPCGYAVSRSWLWRAFQGSRVLIRKVPCDRHLLTMAVRGTRDVMALLVVSKKGAFTRQVADYEAMPHLCRAVGIAWESRTLRDALEAQKVTPARGDSADLRALGPVCAARVRRERALRKRAQEAEQVSRFLATTSTLLGTSLDYNTTLKQALRLAIPDLGQAAQLDMLLPNRRVTRWQGQLTQDGQPEARLARAVEMDDSDPRFAMQRRALQSMGGSVVARSFGRQQLMMPLYSRGKILGVLTVVRTVQLRRRSRARGSVGSLLACFARRVAAALDNAQLHAQLSRAVRVRNEFLAMASHELRTPVMAMSLKLEHLLRSLKGGHVSLLTGDVLKAHMASKLDGALQCSDRLSQLVSNLVDVSHLRADHMTLTRGRCSLKLCVDSVVEICKTQLTRRSCVIESDIAEDVWGYWDQRRIAQMVNHLVSNAIKYGAGRPIVITGRQHNGDAVLQVTDQGIGIDPRSLQRIFGRFERATSIRSYGGFGLGLYITREIIYAHGGVLNVQSAPEQGATFEVRLPMAKMPLYHDDAADVARPAPPAPRA